MLERVSLNLGFIGAFPHWEGPTDLLQEIASLFNFQCPHVLHTESFVSPCDQELLSECMTKRSSRKLPLLIRSFLTTEHVAPTIPSCL